MKKIYVGIIGFGTVGKGLAHTLIDQKQRIIEQMGAEIVLSQAASTSLESLPEKFAHVLPTKHGEDIINNPDIDIVVELIGGMEPAKSFLLQAIENGKHVVTANKALLSVHGREIFAAAAKAGVEVGFEASVGGGIPVIKALKEGLAANRINSIKGIMNGTGNYILTQMAEHGLPFAEVLKTAQKLGYAEADPTYDVEGIDTAHKLAILMNIAYGMNVHLDDISIEGISSIEPVDLEMAENLSYRIKLLAVSNNHGEHVEARVHPAMVPENHMLAAVGGAFNAIYFNGDTVGDVMLYGPGAGMMPTGSAVAADVVDIGRNILSGAVGRVPALAWQPENMVKPSITPMGELVCPFYFRLAVNDNPELLAEVTEIFAKYHIQISLLEKRSCDAENLSCLVFITEKAKEAETVKAVDEINRLKGVVKPVIKIRILAEN
ncbi:MAG: homoserine dehydrogenase [Deltaproteobacteria bacterium]|nr:MAG: homoserine dehydrogenase [Deltaproteobacteria bacterium]